jgi:hypothetical protein
VIRSGLRSPEIELGGGSAADVVQSLPGEFSVPSIAAVGDLMYSSGADALARADNGSISTAPAIAIVIAKPTSTTATVVYLGRVEVFTALAPGVDYYVGTNGALIPASSLPSTPGSVAQKVGTALAADALLFEPGEIVIL